jgi:hypothetical protein
MVVWKYVPTTFVRMQRNLLARVVPFPFATIYDIIIQQGLVNLHLSALRGRLTAGNLNNGTAHFFYGAGTKIPN